MWEVEYTDEFDEWWETLSEAEQITVAAHVELLEKLGPNLKFPYSSGIQNSIHSHMRELRIQHAGNPYRVLYAFDPRRTALLLIGDNKTSEKRWYDKFIPIADKLYTEHLITLEKRGINNMAKSFKTLKTKMAPSAQQAVSKQVMQMLSEMPLQELRQAKHLSQEHLAEVLDTKQANISRIERRTDMYISTLRSYIEAMGGELDIVAKFPDGEIRINQFRDIETRAY